MPKPDQFNALNALNNWRELDDYVTLAIKQRDLFLENLPFIDSLTLDVGSLYCSASRYSNEISLSGYYQVKGFTTEAAPDLFDLLEWIEDELGVEAGSNPNPKEGTITYYFNTGGVGGILNIYITAQLIEDGLCQRVITGTQKKSQISFVEVDEPVYKFVC